MISMGGAGNYKSHHLDLTKDLVLVGLVGYAYHQLTGDSGSDGRFGCDGLREMDSKDLPTEAEREI
jgi:hypothetical protein